MHQTLNKNKIFSSFKFALTEGGVDLQAPVNPAGVIGIMSQHLH